MRRMWDEKQLIKIAEKHGGGSGVTKAYVDQQDALKQDKLSEEQLANIAAVPSKANASDIPTKTNELENNSGFLTEHQDISGKQDKLTAGANITINSDNVISATGGGGLGTGTEELTFTYEDGTTATLKVVVNNG